MNLEAVAIKFAQHIQGYMVKLDIDDICLYGSIARGLQNPRDIDIMILHHNPVFDKIQKTRGNDGCSDDFERYALVIRELESAGYPGMDGLLDIPECREAIKRGLLNIVYLNTIFFKDSRYRREIIDSNKEPKFFRNAFSSGMLWNEENERFDIPAISEYNIS